MLSFLKRKIEQTQSDAASTEKQGHVLLEEDYRAHLTFMENMDRVNKVIQGTNNLEQMMRDVLKEVLSILDCDRVWLFYPCDPDAPTFQVPMEVTKSQYPGAGILNTDIPLPPDMAENLREALGSGPVTFVVGTERPINKVSAEHFGVKSMMMTAIYPKSGKPWAFGLHQCSYPRIWKEEEKELFQEISRRLADGLSSLLVYRDLQKSEERYRRILETAAEGIWIIDKERITTFVNARILNLLGYTKEEMLGRKFDDFVVQEERIEHEQQMAERREGMSNIYERRIRRKDDGVVWCSVSAAPIFDEKKDFAGSFAMFTDITGRKEAEEKQAKYLKELESMNSIMVGREIKMIEMKKENEELKKLLMKVDGNGKNAL
ncbi:MAG: PAS domain S-box protein [Minisyncoccia bacterium]